MVRCKVQTVWVGDSSSTLYLSGVIITYSDWPSKSNGSHHSVLKVCWFIFEGVHSTLFTLGTFGYNLYLVLLPGVKLNP